MERALSQPQPRLSLLGHLPRLLSEWRRNALTRRHLAALSELQLADIGISPSERVREISKPFWRG
ncbi:DUF1127 domain-containing protein [Pseudomonas sp. PDNC002]|uniref:DUF1127 domain-containing protein n=1 Tax=Pseudomonas sp. PDNC002 TaxID=2811422 RepID=UPI001965CBE0|nr:DUF1127 domain-containing protein [Pseudomonas sp. PDNC002]QRY80617.1 DUF1127 domain-containing protein [Pseudomonas sp. PDNC002]